MRPESEPDEAARARRRHAAVRRANRTETAEDYVEAIDTIATEHGEARVRDLARCFGVSHVTVSRTVDRLQRDGLVTTAPYRPIQLTEAGLEMARASKERHAAVLRFLLALGLPPEFAQEDAEGIEHHVGPATLAAFAAFVERVSDPAELARREAAAEELSAPLDADPSRFARVREAHATELIEDYVEAIADLIAENDEARVVDLSRRFGVSHATVSRAVGRLQRDGYVATDPPRPIRLTGKGRTLADESRRRHEVVLDFFLWLGVDPGAAEIDAEGVEHHVGPRTLEIFRSRVLGAHDPGQRDGPGPADSGRRDPDRG